MNITIAGAGSISRLLAEKLTPENHNIKIIEKSAKAARYAAEHLDVLVLDGDVLDIHTMRRAKTGGADIFAALTQIDEVNILSCQIAKKLGAKKTIARVSNPQYIFKKRNIFSAEEIGVDMFIHPEYETAEAIARLIRQTGTTDIIEMDSGIVQFLGLYIDDKSQFLYTPFHKISETFGDLQMFIVCIKRRTKTIIPGGDDRLIPGDQIFFICNPDNKKEILKIFGKEDVAIENIMVVGGGQIGRFVCKRLEKDINMKVIEINEKKAADLAACLDKTLVIQGDGSDLDLLHSEGLVDMDEVITVTGDDETNIITTTISRHLQVPRNITLINKNEYLPLISALGLEAVVSKHHLTVDAIRNYIRRETVAQYTELPGSDAAVIEFDVAKKSKVDGKALKNIKFPKRALIGAVLKNKEELVIPSGDTVITENDRVIVFCEPDLLESLDKLFK